MFYYDSCSCQTAIFSYQRESDVLYLSVSGTLDMRRVGEAVSRRRLRLGMTQRDLAAAAGISQPHVSAIETGQSAVGLEVMAQVARALAASVDDLLRDAGWLEGTGLEGELSAVYEAMSDVDRRTLIEIGRVLLEAREGLPMQP